MEKLDRRLITRARYLLGLAFFFCQNTRQRDFWSAIPMGNHRAIGLVCHNEFFTQSDVQHIIDVIHLAEDESQYIDLKTQLQLHAEECGCGENAILGIEWSVQNTYLVLNRLIRYQIERQQDDARIYIRRGFVMADIFIDLLRKQGADDCIPAVSTIMTYEDKDQEANLSIFPEYIYGRPQQVNQRAIRNSFALFDLGNLASVLSGARGNTSVGTGEYKIIVINHDVNIPVGLGLSLPILPFLFRRLQVNNADRYWWEFVRDQCVMIYGKPQGTVSARDMFLRMVSSSIRNCLNRGWSSSGLASNLMLRKRMGKGRERA